MGPTAVDAYPASRRTTVTSRTASLRIGDAPRRVASFARSIDVISVAMYAVSKTCPPTRGVESAPRFQNRRGPLNSVHCSHRIDDAPYFRDLARGKAAQTRVLLDRCLAVGEVNAEGFVGRDEGLQPLHLAGELREAALDVAAAPLSCSRSRLPTAGRSRSIT